MRAFVFTDKSLARHAGRFVWLEIDTEKASNAGFRRKFPVQALPTFFVVDPVDEKVAVRWVGGMTVAQIDRLASSDALESKRHARGPDAELARADSLYGEADNPGAARAYEAVLGQTSPRGPRYARIVDALLFALSQADSSRRCVEIAHEALPNLRGSPGMASAAASGLDCALNLPATDPDRARWIAEFEAACRAALADTTLDIAADDRSGIYGSLVTARTDARDDPGHHAVAAEWASFLEREAARATTKEQRAVFDPHRLSAYLELGEPERAIPMLEQSRRDFPEDYNPPARLAIAYRAMKQWAKALEASNEAMAKAYGPRKLRLYDTRADIYAGAGDSTAARHTLEEAVRFGEALPAGQRSESSIAGIKNKLAHYR